MTLCGDNVTSTLDLKTATVSNVVKDSGQYGGYIYVMKRHRLMNIVCNWNHEIRLLVGGTAKCKSKHQFM